MRGEKGELASARSARSVHKQEGELKAKASLHTNAECEVRAVEHVTLCERWTRGGLQQDGGTSPETRNRNFRKENISKAYTETKGRHDGVVRHTIRRRRRYSRGVERKG